jgi:Uma2 family endonuclease
METVVTPPRTGMEAFRLMPEGTLCQLINDVLVMSPAPLMSHSDLLSKIFGELYHFSTKNKLGKVFCAPTDVYLNRTNAYQPDIIFIKAERLDIIKEDGVYGAPDLVIEILSKGTRKKDLGEKKAVYELEGVQEYWVLDPQSKWAEGFVLKGSNYVSLGASTGRIQFLMFDLEITF